MGWRRLVTATVVITDASPRCDIEAAIAGLRAKALRWSRVDPRRDEVDAEVDELVDMWVRAEA